MDIAVIGPCGDVGRQIVQQIVVERLLQCEERLVLIANPEGASARSAYGLAADLADAYSEIAPKVEVVLDPRETHADLVVVAAGATPASSPDASPMTRDALAARNAPMFHRHAEAIAGQGQGHEIVLCISNPNELAVAVFAEHLGRRRVIGIGAFLDSLRFRQEIATDLGVRRQRVHAFIAGEHGSNLVPLWSTVHVHGFDSEALSTELLRIRKGIDPSDFRDAVESAMREIEALIGSGRIRDAYAAVERHAPDVRVVIRPFITHYSGAKTVIGTARATMEFLRTITLGSDALVSGQIALDGEVYDIRGTVGVPFVVGNLGVDRVFELPLTEAERSQLCNCATAIRAKTLPFLHEPPA